MRALPIALLLVIGTASTTPADDARTLQMAGIASDGPALLQFIKDQTASKDDAARIAQLVKQLGDDDFTLREKAAAQLAALGPKALDALRKARADKDPEVASRAETILKRIDEGSAAAVVAAAVRLLAVRRPQGTVKTLLAYLPETKADDVQDSIQDTLTALAVQGGKVDPSLSAALTDTNPRRRQFAGVALAGVKEARPAVRKLQQDDTLAIRSAVGLALLRAGDREALPGVIALLDRDELPELGQIEEVLYRLAGDKAPSAVVGTDAESRTQYRKEWQAWFEAEGARIDLARLTKQPKLKGHTLIVLLDRGKVVYLDDKNKPLWEVNDLTFPLDAQLLPNDRLLVAEHGGSRVTERDLKGKVLWEHKVDQPLLAQRLPNGNTFIATPTQLLEVNKEGKEVLALPPPDRGQVMKALRLPNGDIACVTQLGGVKFQVINRNGKQTRGFGVELGASGGRLEMLPNGHILIPEMNNNRVVEYNRQGKAVWQTEATEPINAVRLPSGHTLITTMSDTRAVEVDARGKTIWDYRTDTRVTRAWRY